MPTDKKIDLLLEDILGDASGEDEQLRAFLTAFQDGMAVPARGSVIGESVTVVMIDYTGNEQRGLLATIRKADGKEYEIALSDVEFPPDSKAYPLQQAYHRWQTLALPRKLRQAEYREKIKKTKATVGEIDLTQPVDLVVLGVKKFEAARCRVLGKDKELTLRNGRIHLVVPGEIVRVKPKKHWSFAGHPYMTGDILKSWFDLPALNLTPLALNDEGMWNPEDEYWGEKEDGPLPKWAMAIIAVGPRPMFEMEQVVPGVKREDLDIDTDPILQAVELKDSGDLLGATKVLADLLILDLRCLDAHAHLGNFAFHRDDIDVALRHYDIGRQIGELSLGPDFKNVLRWAMIDNRPYLRCFHGYGLCLWRLKRFDEAAAIFTRMLWMNPSDNQGARFNLEDVRDKEEWEDREED